MRDRRHSTSRAKRWERNRRDCITAFQGLDIGRYNRIYNKQNNSENCATLMVLGSSIIAGDRFKGFLRRGRRVVRNGNIGEVWKERLSNVAVEEAERITGLGKGRARSAGDNRSVSGCR